MWLEYAKATHDHVRAETKLKLAALEADVEAVERFTRAAENALNHRESMREAIRKHEALHAQAIAP